MSYLDRLKKTEKVGGDYPNKPKEFKKTNCLGLLGTLPVTLQKLQATETASRWWRVHYPDREPVQVWTSPTATMVEIMAIRPDAITAQPIDLDELKPITACSTCDHATYRGGCGEPVAAGLSALEGVIAYSLDQGATCSAWQLKHPS